MNELDEGLWDNIRKKKMQRGPRGEKMRKKGEKFPTQDQIKKGPQEECCAECLGYYDHQLTRVSIKVRKSH